MVSRGHHSLRSEDAAGFVEEAAVLPHPGRPTRPEMPGYQSAKARRPSAPARAESAGLILESAPPGEAGLGVAVPASAGSFGDSVVLEVVIGNDDRRRVTNVQAFPWRQICALRIMARTGKQYVGTGWLIGRHALATAGHCVFLHREQGWARFIDVILALDGTARPFGAIRATRFRAVDGWVQDKRRDCDYAVIQLDDVHPGDQLGWFEVAAEVDGDLVGTTVNISGYPADLDQAARQYFHARELVNISPEFLLYDIDTYGGQSGSPIWQTVDDRRVAVGVHTTGGFTENSGTRITPAILDNFATWREQPL
jgi:glutamyl endopeptidase